MQLSEVRRRQPPAVAPSWGRSIRRPFADFETAGEANRLEPERGPAPARMLAGLAEQRQPAAAALAGPRAASQQHAPVGLAAVEPAAGLEGRTAGDSSGE